MNHAPLRVALIVDSGMIPNSVYELVRWAALQSGLTISHAIVQLGARPAGNRSGAAPPAPNESLMDRVHNWSYALMMKAENRLLARAPLYRDHLKTHRLQDIVPNVLVVSPMASDGGARTTYADEDIERVRSLGLDLIVLCQPLALHGAILDASTFGVIEMCYGDERIYRNGPPGFWEVYYRQDETAFRIRLLTNDDEGGKVLIGGQFPTKFLSLLNQASLYKKSNAHLMQLLLQVAATRSLPAPGLARSRFEPACHTPRLPAQIRYVCDRSLAIANKLVSRLLLKRHYRWGVAFSRNDWKSVVMGQSHRVVNPPNHFLADPFVIHEGMRDFCFVEDYDYACGKGHIAVWELKDKVAEPLGDAIVEPFHMSFPYLFRFGGKLYMCPETNARKQIRLYECIRFPLEWRLCKVLMDNVSAVDTMIFERDKTWWMFTNIDPANADDNCSELFIFHSDDPVNGNWIPHAANPVVIDSSKARNAGLLFDENDVYRVAQKQAFDLYGHGFSINKISVLNTEQYVETQVRAVKPNFYANLKGTHHMHSNGTVSVFDYLRHMAISK